jgi:uncharacterized protein (DUF305 family)
VIVTPAKQSALNWRSALMLGLVSSTFSTLVSQFLAGRIGRDAAVDWMVVASIPLRDPALQVEPTAGPILAGILFHQSADIAWALFFFGLLGRWTARLSPQAILAAALPWAFFTSAMEWLFLVPLIPFWQPIFTLDQPYWIGFLVHLTSASMYPLFPFVRDWVSGDLPSPHRRFATAWSSLAAVGVIAVGMLAFLGSQGRELPHMGGGADFDRAYMRRMSAHHAQGVEIAKLASRRAADPHLRALARLMVATQTGELVVFDRWWRSWFDGPLPAATMQDHGDMPGMLSSEQIRRLRDADPSEFDRFFVELMTFHHLGAIAMADDARHRAGDARLRIMSHSIRHQQIGQIGLMHGIEGPAAVGIAVLAVFGFDPEISERPAG